MAVDLTPSFEVIDPRFRQLAFPNVHVAKLHTGGRRAEGPTWFAAGRYLGWSDIPNDRMLRDETDGSVSVFRQPAMSTNAHTVDPQGRLVSCEHRGRCVWRTEHDSRRTVLASQIEGKRLNSPNDVVVKSDGSIWSTNSSYGIDSDYEGDAAPARSAIAGSTALRRTAARSSRWPTTSCSRTAWRSRPTRACSTSPTPAPRTASTAPATSGASACEPMAAASLAGKFLPTALQCSSTAFALTPEAICGRAPATACVATRPKVRLGKIRVPETVANVCFGGPKLNWLFVCATTSLYSVYLNAHAAARPGVG